MDCKEAIIELIKKIELQSIIVLVITLISGIYLIKCDNSLSSPSGIMGMVAVGFGILYTVISFYTNNIRESYKDVINEYKASIETMKANHGYIQDSYKETLATNSTGGYRSESQNTDVE